VEAPVEIVKSVAGGEGNKLDEDRQKKVQENEEGRGDGSGEQTS